MSTGSSSARIYDIGAGATLNWTTQNVSTSANQAGFIKNGDGIWNIGAQGNAYNAANSGFTLNAGTVIVGGNNSFGGANSLLTINGGTIQSSGTRAYTNNIVIGGNFINSGTGNATFSGTVALGSDTRTITNSLTSGSRTYSGVISGASGSGLTFNGSGAGETNITNASNTFTGDININGGEVRFTTNGSLGNSANDIIIDGGRFSKASDATTVTLGAARTIAVGDGVGTGISSPGSGTLIYNGEIANKSGETGSWAKQGGGILELGGVSTYTGNTAINNGTVRLTTGNDRLPTTTTLTLGQAASENLGTLDLNGRNQQVAGVSSVTGTSAAVNNNIITSSTPATLTLGGSGSYSYGDGTAANSGVITGAIALLKSGLGTQTLGDSNTYSGGTTLTGGSLNVVNTIDSATGTGNVLIQDTATLQGSGRIAPITGGTIIVEDGGTVAIGDLNAAPAQGAKILTVTPASGTITTTFETGSTLRFDLFTNAGDNYAIASAADLFRTGGDLTFQDGVILSVNKSGTFSFADGNRWRLLDWGTLSGSITGTSSALTLDLPTLDTGLFWDVSSLYTNGSIAVMIPEPSRTLFLALGLLTLTLRRRR